jgi:hypothetical protein
MPDLLRTGFMDGRSVAAAGYPPDGSLVVPNQSVHRRQEEVWLVGASLRLVERGCG